MNKGTFVLDLLRIYKNEYHGACTKCPIEECDMSALSIFTRIISIMAVQMMQKVAKKLQVKLTRAEGHHIIALFRISCK